MISQVSMFINYRATRIQTLEFHCKVDPRTVNHKYLQSFKWSYHNFGELFVISGEKWE